MHAHTVDAALGSLTMVLDLPASYPGKITSNIPTAAPSAGSTSVSAPPNVAYTSSASNQVMVSPKTCTLTIFPGGSANFAEHSGQVAFRDGEKSESVKWAVAAGKDDESGLNETEHATSPGFKAAVDAAMASGRVASMDVRPGPEKEDPRTVPEKREKEIETVIWESEL
jgi:hypothetical protein